MNAMPTSPCAYPRPDVMPSKIYQTLKSIYFSCFFPTFTTPKKNLHLIFATYLGMYWIVWVLSHVSPLL